MQVLLAVIVDLYHFLQGLFSHQRTEGVVAATLTLPLRSEPRLLSPLHPATTVLPASSAVPTDVPVATATYARADALLIAEPSVTLHHDPTEAFDNVVLKLSYATPVSEIRRSGRWLLIETLGKTGWVLADAVAQAAAVLPQFSLGHAYAAMHVETIKLRAYIGDSFAGARAQVPLSGVEYVTYRLLLAGRAVPWSQAYNRLPGTWQRKLRGLRGVHIDVMPHTGSVMEYIIDDVGYVAYVEKVAPDLKVTVSGIGLTNDSQYTEQVLPHGVWRELRPVFIQVS